MPSEEHYNDVESYYFLLFVLAIITLPWTYIFVKYNILGHTGEPENVHCNCSLCKAKTKAKDQPKKKPVGTIVQSAVLVVLWALLIFVSIKVANSEGLPEPKPAFDPYAILGLESGASLEEIKKAYRQLVIIHHPDHAQNPNDPEVKNRFIDIGKAYEVLTDPDTREKYEKYGNPDGPQASVIGIGLPSWLVKGENAVYVIGVYLSLLVVGLPSVVCCWWRSWKKVDSTKVQNQTMGLYYHKIEQLARVKVISELIAVSTEYSQMQVRTSDEPNLQRINKLVPDAHAMKKKPKYTVPFGIKVNTLFYAQMSRLQEQLSPGLKEDLETVLVQVRPLLGGFITIATAKGMYVPLVESLMFTQQLTQSTWNKEDLLQLPHITRDMWDVFNSKKKNCGDLARFTAIGQEKRQVLLKEEGLNDAQIQDVEVVLSYLPTDVNIKFDCRVEGGDSEKIVSKAVVTLFYTVYRGKDDSELEEDDDDDGGFFSSSDSEGEDDEKKKQRKERREKRKKRQQQKKNEEKEDALKRYVHAPFFPEKREESWWIVIGDVPKSALIAIHKVPSFGKKNQGKIKFMAPEQPGTYVFTVQLMCDGYLGCDKSKPLKMTVVRDESKPVVVPEKKKGGAKIKEIKEEDSDASDDDLSDRGDDDYSMSGSESD